MPKRKTDEEIIEALYKANGILAAAADDLGITRQTIYNRMEKNTEIEEAYREAAETATDKVEHKLLKNCLVYEKESSIFYYLNNKGRSRGYGKPTLIAPTDPTGKKEYGADIRKSIMGKLFPESASEGETG